MSTFVGYYKLSESGFRAKHMCEFECEELERLTYLIVGKVGPWVLIRYNVLRDKLKAEYENKN
ncbi:MAG TPA: hypothetical protein VN739_01765 [Nitrososphaerales archaeon]|nr:hypothetical protein [Nitrososphaerales archaeon]